MPPGRFRRQGAAEDPLAPLVTARLLPLWDAVVTLGVSA
jgi:hypothetical protein